MNSKNLAVLEPYCENDMKRLKRISRSIFMKFNESLSNADYDDFYSVANLVLWQAYNSYDPKMGVKFEGFLHSVVFQIKRAANLQIILAPYKIDVVLQPHYPETLLHITRTKILPCKLIAQEYSVSSYENGSSSSSIWQA